MDMAKTTGISPKTYLEQALRDYTTLAVGDVIDLSSDGSVHSFNVTEIRPDVPAVSIFGSKSGVSRIHNSASH